jgi:hypothetical protein
MVPSIMYLWKSSGREGGEGMEKGVREMVERIPRLVSRAMVHAYTY